MASRTAPRRPVEVPDFEGVPEVAPTVLKSVQGLLAAHASSDHELAKAVLKALRPRDGRSQRCTRDELPERLEQDGVTFDPDELDEALSRLWDVGQVVLAQLNSGYPLHVVPTERHPFDDVDALRNSAGSGDCVRTNSALIRWCRVSTSHPGSLPVEKFSRPCLLMPGPGCRPVAWRSRTLEPLVMQLRGSRARFRAVVFGPLGSGEGRQHSCGEPRQAD